MSDVTLPRPLIPGTPENILDVWEDLVALRDKMNGQIDLDNLSAAMQQMFTLPGTIIMHGALVAPVGYLLCDGSSQSRSGFSDLFAAIGTHYGVGDGVSSFNLPDLRGSVPVGHNPTGHADHDTLGKMENGVPTPGAGPAYAISNRVALAVRRLRHKHSSAQTDHVHTAGERKYNGAAGTDNSYLDKVGSAIPGSTTEGTSGGQANITIGPQDSGTATDTPPFQVVNFFIKT